MRVQIVSARRKLPAYGRYGRFDHAPDKFEGLVAFEGRGGSSPLGRIAAWMGHSLRAGGVPVSTTATTYTHPTGEHRRQALEELYRLFGSPASLVFQPDQTLLEVAASIARNALSLGPQFGVRSG
jgi:hypothetical protein